MPAVGDNLSVRVVYVSHNAVGSPLVRSQVLPYLRRLSDMGHQIQLVTFERGGPFPDGEFPRDRWHPLESRPGRSLFAKVVDIARGALHVMALARRTGSDVLHARSYLPAAICWIAARVLGLRFVFDMRGFMGEEYVDGGLWRPGEMRDHAVRLIERRLLAGAAWVVVLTHAAGRRLRTEPRYAGAVRAPVTVVPCTVDLVRFAPIAERAEAPTLVYSGSLGTWYLLDEMLRLFLLAREMRSDLRFVLLNQNDHALISTACVRLCVPRDAIDIRAVDPSEMPRQLARGHVGIALLKRVPSKIGSSPVKIAEYLACGLPVIASAGIGDTDEQLRGYQAGYIVESLDDEGLLTGAANLVRLLDDEDARSRARNLAVDVFDVRAGSAAYATVYEGLARQPQEVGE